MALYAFDGTGNEDRDGEELDSNALLFFRGYDDPNGNDEPKEERGSLYLKGIGTRALTKVGERLAEAFGIGGHKRVRQALDRLENNVEAGDDVIDIVGFSRGAALAISFANEISHKFQHLPIRFIGVWDIVGQFGLPGTHVQCGHDLRMPRGARRCVHAMALDETRALFPLTRLCGAQDDERLVEVWFRGVHSDIGGGNGNCGLNWISLNWIYQNAIREGLPIRAEAVAKNLLHRAKPQQVSNHPLDLVRRQIRETDCLHTSVALDPGHPERPHNNPRATLKRLGDPVIGANLPPAPNQATRLQDDRGSGKNG
jgi:uncharacterized protein (DUF2235 family)